HQVWRQRVASGTLPCFLPVQGGDIQGTSGTLQGERTGERLLGNKRGGLGDVGQGEAVVRPGGSTADHSQRAKGVKKSSHYTPPHVTATPCGARPTSPAVRARSSRVPAGQPDCVLRDGLVPGRITLRLRDRRRPSGSISIGPCAPPRWAG